MRPPPRRRDYRRFRRGNRSIKSAARCAWLAAVKVARLSFFRISSQWAM